MLGRVKTSEHAGKELRATGLVFLVALALQASFAWAEPPTEPKLTIPAKPASPAETAFSQPAPPEPVLEPSLGFTPGSLVNSLREKLTTPSATTAEVIATPPAEPPVPPQQKVIPITKSGDQNNLIVEDHEGQISLMVRDAPLRQVVALIAETQKLNLVFAAPAETRVTASFDRVPWEQVLDSLLTAAGHTWTTSHGIITVSAISQAEGLSPTTDGRRVEVFELDFASAVDIDQTVKGLLSPAGQSWIMETNSMDNRRTREVVAVIDYPANLQQVGDYICQADQPPRQVLIEANILQIDLSSECRSGIDLGAISRSASGNAIELDPVNFANAASSPAFFLEATGGAVTAIVELLQTTTDAKTLASPKVLAVSGQQSRIQIGGQIGYRGAITTNASQTSTQEVQFLETGVILTVTPRVTRDGRVLMRVKPEVSTGELSADDLPNKETTNVESDVMLCDGQGMVIGGLIQETDRNVQSKLPWIADLPYVGILFQRRNVTKVRAEIIVTLVPHIQPYTPMIENRQSVEVMRSTDPLIVGPLIRHPRPYEAMLPDTFRNPRRPLVALLQPLPPVEEGGAVYCPPPETQMMLAPVPEEARRDVPEFHE